MLGKSKKRTRKGETEGKNQWNQKENKEYGHHSTQKKRRSKEKGKDRDEVSVIDIENHMDAELWEEQYYIILSQIGSKNWFDNAKHFQLFNYKQGIYTYHFYLSNFHLLIKSN